MESSITESMGVLERAIMLGKKRYKVTVQHSTQVSKYVVGRPCLPCFTGSCCISRWMMTEWTPCSRTCGKGMQSRQVACTQQLSNGTLIRARERDCTGPKPASAQRCEGQDCMTVWEAGVWSEVRCSPRCPHVPFASDS